MREQILKNSLIITAVILILLVLGGLGAEATSATSMVSMSNYLSTNAPDQIQVDYFFQLLKKLHPQDGAPHFGGDAIAVEGDTLVVGDLESNSYTGTVYTFERNEGDTDNWGLSRQLFDAEGEESDYLGGAVALNGDTLVVGADGADSYNGAVLVFERNQGGTNNWGLVTKINGPDAGSRFGTSIAIYADTMIVGAGSVAFATGGAYIFDRNKGGADNWGQVVMLTATDASDYIEFGGAVAIEGDTIVVGARRDEYGNPSNQGSAYVFERNEGGADNWGQVGKIIGDGDDGAYFGSSLAIEGDTLAVGAPGHSPGLASSRGAAFVFRRNLSHADHWELVTMLIDPSQDSSISENFGYSLAIEGDILIVGHFARNVDEIVEQGAVFVFEQNAGGANNWGQTAMLTDPDDNHYDWFGTKVAFSGSTLFVGAPGDDDFGDSWGAVHIFEKEPYFKVFLPAIIRQ